MPSLRKRIERSQRLATAVGSVMGWYIRLCLATGRWRAEGGDALQADLQDGAVLAICWHGRLLMIGPHWPKAAGSLSCLHDTSPIARAAGALQAHFGLDPFEMSARRSNLSASREVMKRARAGTSIGVTADGPKGPGFAVKDAPLEWARTLQRPIYVYAFAARWTWRLQTWDKMAIPLPFGGGAHVFARVDTQVPRKADAEVLEQARQAIQAALDAATARAETLARAAHSQH